MFFNSGFSPGDNGACYTVLIVTVCDFRLNFAQVEFEYAYVQPIAEQFPRPMKKRNRENVVSFNRTESKSVESVSCRALVV